MKTPSLTQQHLLWQRNPTIFSPFFLRAILMPENTPEVFALMSVWLAGRDVAAQSPPLDPADAQQPPLPASAGTPTKSHFYTKPLPSLVSLWDLVATWNANISWIIGYFLMVPG